MSLSTLPSRYSLDQEFDQVSDVRAGGGGGDSSAFLIQDEGDTRRVRDKEQEVQEGKWRQETKRDTREKTDRQGAHTIFVCVLVY
jgi:hypothetical protein